MRKSYSKLLLATILVTSVTIPTYAQGISDDTVVVASKQSPTDILPAATLSNYIGSDLVILDHENMQTGQLDKNKKILVVGGTMSLKDDLFEGINFQRLSGRDRYETSLSVLKYADKIKKVRSVNLISGKSYADSAIVASSNKLAVLVSDSKQKNATIKECLDSLSIKDRTVIGGTMKVDNHEKDFLNASRIAGNNRYETAKIFAGQNKNGYISSEAGSYYQNIMDAKKAAEEGKGFLFVSPSRDKYIINVSSSKEGTRMEIGEFLINKNDNIQNMIDVLDKEIKANNSKKVESINPTLTAFDIRVKSNTRVLFITPEDGTKELHIAISKDGSYPKEYLVKDSNLIKLINDAIDKSIYSEYRSEEHTSELQSRQYLVCRLLLEKKKNTLYQLSPLSTRPC